MVRVRVIRHLISTVSSWSKTGFCWSVGMTNPNQLKACSNRFSEDRRCVHDEETPSLSK